MATARRRRHLSANRLRQAWQWRSATVPLVSPLRGGGVEGKLEVSIGRRLAQRTCRLSDMSGGDESDMDDEPPMPDDLVAVEMAVAEKPTLPATAPAGQALHVHFYAAAQDTSSTPSGHCARSSTIVRVRPASCSTCPTADGRRQRMDLRVGVAYDAELLASIQRRVGGSVELRLAD